MFIVGYKCMYRALCKLVYLNKMCAFACTNIVVLQDELSTIKKLAVAISTLRFFFLYLILLVQSIFSTHGNIILRKWRFKYLF